MKIDLSKLKRAVKRMEAENKSTGTPFDSSFIKDRARKEPTTTNLTRAELKRLRVVGGSLILDGEQIVVHIGQPNISTASARRGSSGRDVTLDDIESNIEARPKVHVTNCQTLEEMKRKGAFEARYVKVANPNGQFEIYPRKSFSNERVGDKLIVTLRPCIHCLRELGYEGCDGMLWTSGRRLKLAQAVGNDPERMKKLFDSGSFIMGCDSLHTAKTMPENVYTKDWWKISLGAREKANWRCQQCGVDLHDYRAALHVHHRNRDRRDNSRSNLVVLCALCHQQQPGHKHLRVLREHRDEIISRRKAQNISPPPTDN